MSNENAAPAAPRLEWKVESLRLTGLNPSPTEMGAARTLWTTVVGDEPETSTERKGSIQTAEGPFRDCRLSLTVSPGRLDWACSADQQEALNVPMQIVCSFAEAKDVFDDIAQKWTGSLDCPSFQRVALGAVLLSPTESRETGYEQLNRLLECVELDPKSTDFSYQINRPMEFESGDVTIPMNRLSRWSVAVFQMGHLTVSLANGLGTGGIVNRVHACRLVLDINTAAEFQGTLEPNQIRAIYRRLYEEAAQIAAEGDRA